MIPRAVLVVAILMCAPAAGAAPQAQRHEDAARRAVTAARTECGKPGRRLTALVERYFDPGAFGASVIAGWSKLTDEQHQAFAPLADEVVGAQERAAAIAAICRKGARIVDVRDGDQGRVWMKLRAPDDDDCTTLIFRDDGDRWTFDEEWFCGKSLFRERWIRTLGGGDYDKAMAYLRGAAGA